MRDRSLDRVLNCTLSSFLFLVSLIRFLSFLDRRIGKRRLLLANLLVLDLSLSQYNNVFSNPGLHLTYPGTFVRERVCVCVC